QSRSIFMTKRNVWRLARRPTLAINEDDLQFGNETLRDLVQGEVLLRVRYLSIDPAQRVFMGEQEQFIAPIAIGSPVIGVVVGVVVETLNDALPTGTMLTGLGEWADYIITDGKGFTALPDVAGRNLSEVFGTLSLVGPTAYFGLLDIGRPSPGETLV